MVNTPTGCATHLLDVLHTYWMCYTPYWMCYTPTGCATHLLDVLIVEHVNPPKILVKLEHWRTLLATYLRKNKQSFEGGLAVLSKIF